jgi:transcriptional regulator with XRE-family HTH domain
METIRDVICKNFNRLVESSDLSNKTIAQKAGVTEPTFYRWKNGENTPELPNIESLAKALGVDPIEFYQAEFTPRQLPVSATLRKMMAIPDEVYELASELELEDEVWIEVVETLMIAAEQKSMAKKG